MTMLLRQQLIGILVLASLSFAANSQQLVIESNDNLEPAGTVEGNTVSLNLIAEEGMWYPGGVDKPGAIMQAFREEGKPLLIPGPMLRAKEGTTVLATIRNAMPGTELHFHGFQNRPQDEDSPIVIPYGETKTARFVLNISGIYHYWASTEGRTLTDRRGIDSYMSGAIVVDPADHEIEGRIFVIGEGSSVPGKREHSFNGRSFPNTERLQVYTGETNTWHFINTSFGGHPLHLHGSHYRVTHRGSMLTYLGFDPGLIRDEVTAEVGIGEIVSIQWEAERPGNWLFHCHISAHVAADSGRLSSGDNHHLPEDAAGLHEMAGMTFAITAINRNANEEETIIPQRRITMLMERQNNYFGNNVGYAVAFNEENNSEILPVAPGPVLVLEKDQPVSIALMNNLGEPTAIHWHGMELQSYYDGVAGFSGNGSSVTPVIKSGESFEVLMTPPRAGTYLYHTHMDDRAQLVKGLYGTLIVNSPEYPYDPEVDKIFVLGLAGDAVRTAARIEGLVINGVRNYATDLQGVRKYRIRLANITANNSELVVKLTSAKESQSWMPVGKDGAQLPEGLKIVEAAEHFPISVGETYDFAWSPESAGTYWLEIRRDNGEWMGQARLNVIP